MGTSEATGTIGQRSMDRAVAMLQTAAGAQKCWPCGCLRHALDTIDDARPAPGHNDALGVALASARERLQPQRYECLGCGTCFPAVALNDLAADGSIDLTESVACPTDAVEERHGWPPLPGNYTVFALPCTRCRLSLSTTRRLRRPSPV